MKNLGKIALFILFIPFALYAAVTASVSSQSVTVGEMVTYNLTVSGENIKRPNIHTLCDSEVISTSSQTSIQIINGDYQKSYVLSYKFIPQKTCEIQPIQVEVNGVLETTKPIKIEVKPMSAAKDADFILELRSDKKEVFVGEPFTIELIFKQKRDAEAVDSKFIPPELTGLWIKGESDPVRFNHGDYTVTKISYMVAAQRAGTLSIKPAQMRIASRDSMKDSWGAWIPQIKWRTYFSNELNVDVKPLPSGVGLVGEFSISAHADKTVVNVNDAVNVTIEVQGDGNLEDITSFKPYIDGVSVFDEKIQISGSTLTQKIAFVSDSDFTIPSFSLKFFDPKTSKIKTISTKPIKITVKGAKQKSELKIKRQEGAESAVQNTAQNNGGFSFSSLLLGFLLGVIVGGFVMFVKPWERLKKEKSYSIKDPKVLLVKLLPYKNDEEVQKIVDILEKNIYSNANIQIDKKLLKEIVKKYDIS